jgi:3-oxo-5-alpha-steroid 4-dehydrogenase 1
MLSFNSFTIIWLSIGLLMIPVLLKISAPYGRYLKTGWGPLINNKLGWIFMELPALLVFSFFFITTDFSKSSFAWFAFSLWIIHYIHRVLIFPFKIKTKGKKMPIAIALMAIFFNYINGYINGHYLGSLNNYHINSFIMARIFIGAFIFCSGMMINIFSDYSLLHLRKNNELGYKIPYNFLFKYISCPNYFGEIMEWFGFVIICWSLPAFAFWIWTVANLLPRALSHHQWYNKQFSDYPKNRKALFPFIL